MGPLIWFRNDDDLSWFGITNNNRARPDCIHYLDLLLVHTLDML